MSTHKIEDVTLEVTPLTGFEVSAFDPHQLRAELLSEASAITKASTAQEAQGALEIAARQKGLVKRIRSLGKIKREPYNNASTQVIKIENEYCDDLETSYKRLERVAADFQIAEQKRIDDERAETARKAKIEADKLAELERRRIEAERKQKEAEEAHKRELERLERERIDAEKRAAEAKGKAAQAKAKAEQERIERERAEAQRIADEEKRKSDAAAQEAKLKETEAALAAEFANEEASASLQSADASKPKGASVRTGWKIEVIDLHALYAAFPRCVELKPKLQEIKDTIRDLERAAAKAGVEDFIPKIPGVTITEETKINARSVAPGLALNK